MIRKLREDADKIIKGSIRAVLPDEAVQKALSGKNFSGRVICVAIGKAAWQMARAAADILGDRMEKGIVITKYGHVKGDIPRFECFEAGHPVPDENSFSATEKAIETVSGLEKEDTVVFLISGGGSALFEKPLVPYSELTDITEQLLSSGASITEINTIRKRLSAVKGGRFAEICSPARVFSIILSDVLGDPVDMIASGPAAPDTSTSEDAKNIIAKHGIDLSDDTLRLLEKETPSELPNASWDISGSVRELCTAAKNICLELGYETEILTDSMDNEASEAGEYLSHLALKHAGQGRKLAFIAGGETVVRLKGKGKGGRNQEMVLAAVRNLSGLNAAFFSVGSDGTDGPTDAAGGYADGDTLSEMTDMGIDVRKYLENNDSYNALKACGGLVFTGPTGTNVNDLSVILIDE